jgi:hypothetical protein
MKVEDFYMGAWHKAESLMIPEPERSIMGILKRVKYLLGKKP